VKEKEETWGKGWKGREENFVKSLENLSSSKNI
jgi:hypothetical protein